MWVCCLYEFLSTILGCNPKSGCCPFAAADPPRLMLVAFDLEDFETFLDALRPNVYPVMYDPDRTTHVQLAQLVMEKGREVGPASVAWANHDPMWGDVEAGDFYSWSWQIAKDDTITLDGQYLPQWRRLAGPETGPLLMQGVSSVLPLINALAAVLPAGGAVHLLGAEVAGTLESRMLVARLDRVTGLQWAASTTITEEGWKLECRGRRIDVGSLYFDERKIAQWKGTTATF